MSSSRRGFVLPTTLLVMTLLTVMLTAAFILVSAEGRTTDNSYATQRAMAIAQAGLDSYLSRNLNLGGNTAYDSTTTPISFANGYAAVAASRIVDTTQGPLAIWLVRSYGYVTDPRLNGQTQARRVIARLARYSPGLLYARAALVSANPTQVTGVIATSNPIDGRTFTCAGGRDTAGLAQAAGDYTTSLGNPLGTPPIENLASRTAVLDSTHIDWAALLGGDFTPDYTVTGGSWPATPSGYPVYYAVGDITVPAGGRAGTLVATGDVTFASGADWHGVIIAGGRINVTLFTTVTVRGSVITGLNNSITPNSVGTNQIRQFLSLVSIRWSACEVAFAMGSLGALSPLRNGWIDTWSTY